MTYNLESLTQAVGPTGDLCRKPCPCGCHGWYGLGDNGPIHPGCQEGKCTGTVWDELDLMVQALWEERPLNCEDEYCYADGRWEDGARRHHLHNEWLPRSRAEAALRLWDASKHLWIRHDWWLVPAAAGWQICTEDAVAGRGGTAEDALAATLEGKLRDEKP